jgi:hypothetical protein
MTSLGFSEYTESNNDSSRNGNGKIYNRRNASNNGNRTLKIPRTTDITPERGLLQSPNGAISGITNENGNNDGVIQQSGKKIKQIKEYIENIHRKGGEDSEEDIDGDNILPSYPAQGMGVYASNITQSGIVRSGSSNTSSAIGPETVVRKTTQLNSLNPGSSYSSTLLEGMNSSASSHPHSPYFEKLTGIASAPKKDGAVQHSPSQSDPFSSSNAKTSTYASQYYEQFVPYAESLAGQLSNGGGSATTMSGTNAALIEKLNYIIHMLEDKKDEKTGHVIEELVLYCFLGVFIIFIVDTFTRTASGSGGRAGAGGGGGAGAFGMFGGARRLAQTSSRLYHR